jgi:hypothetical protein
MRYLVTLRLAPAHRTLEYARHLLEPLGLRIDVQYGLVSISPKRSLFVVRVGGEIDGEALASLPEVAGVHGDPKIAPFAKGGEDSKGD